MSDNKKSAKKINIKNIKEATKTLNKKNSSSPKKNVKKNPKKSLKKEPKKVLVKEENLVVSQPKIEEKKKTSVKNKSLTKDKKASKKGKKEEKSKIVIPKEWKNINRKFTDKSKVETTDNITGKLRSSIFEEVDEKTLAIEKEKNRKLIKKTLLIVAIVTALIFLTTFVIMKYSKYLKEKSYVYQVYTIGEKVTLKDSSVWYVVEDSEANESTVKLLKEAPLDVNEDGKLDDEDKHIYNASNEALYDNTDNNSIGKYLQDVYRLELQKKVGSIDEVTLLTSKEYVKIREKMGFGYEWTEGNWLASSSYGYWWVISNQNEKVYAVGPNGSYKIYQADSYNFIRPVIIIGKEHVNKSDKEEKIVEPEVEDTEPTEKSEILPGSKDVFNKNKN